MATKNLPYCERERRVHAAGRSAADIFLKIRVEPEPTRMPIRKSGRHTIRDWEKTIFTQRAQRARRSGKGKGGRSFFLSALRPLRPLRAESGLFVSVVRCQNPGSGFAGPHKCGVPFGMRNAAFTRPGAPLRSSFRNSRRIRADADDARAFGRLGSRRAA